MKVPEVQFADSPEGKIAYQVVGDGPRDLVYAPGVRGGNIDVLWEHPAAERYLRRLASFSRLILCNPRGTGPSDPIPLGAATSFEEEATDFRYVLDAVGSEGAAFLAIEGGGWGALLFTAASPERTLGLALVDCFATVRRSDDYPWGFPAQTLDKFVEAMIGQWGTGKNLRVMAPDVADDERFRSWFGRLERLTMNPATVAGFAREGLANVDLRGILPSIKAPTLVISHEGMPWVRPGHSRYLAQHIPDARLVERPGFWGIPWLHDVDETLDEVQTFFTGTRGVPDPDDRVLATILLTDIVGSTELAAQIGDRAWRELLQEHEGLVRSEIERFRGRHVKSTGDGLIATFDGPARAIRCASVVGETLRPLGLEIRTGLHTGEIELMGEDVGGIAVHIAARVLSEAEPGQILVSGAVPPLIAGSGIEFIDVGTRKLKGVPGEWKLFEVKR